MEALLFILIMLLLVSIPVLLTYFILRQAKRSKYKKLLYLVAVIPLAIMAYAVYDAVYPADEFYKEDFEEVTGMRFPDNSEIISRSASYPDTHGDYTSAAAMKMSAKELITLSDKIKFSDFKEQPFIVNSGELANVKHDAGITKFKKQYVKEFDDKIFMVGFAENYTIVFCRISW